MNLAANVPPVQVTFSPLGGAFYEYLAERNRPSGKCPTTVYSPNPLCLVIKVHSLQDHCAFQPIADMFNYNPNELPGMLQVFGLAE